MRRELKTILADIKAQRGPQILLVFGDDLQVAESCRNIVDQLVPADLRGFNYERFDGRTATWEQIEASLRTPPFLPGTKLLWVDSAPYFYARDQKGELGEKVLELWRENKREDAAKLLLDLLVLEAWTEDQWNAVDGVSMRALLDLLGVASAEDREDAEALVAFCKERQFDFGGRKGGAHTERLASLLDQGLPEWVFLLLTAVQVDRRTRLFKRLDEFGAVLYLGVDRDRSGRISRESLIEFVGERLRQTGKTLEPRARETLIARAGDDLRCFQQEIEKLLLFVGERPKIHAEDVLLMVSDRGEGWIFDLTRALGDRDAAASLTQLGRLIAQGEHPLKILGTVAAEARRLLSARQLLAGALAKVWRRGMTYTQFQQFVQKQDAPLLGRNPYADYVCLQRAERFSLAELKSFMESLFDADLRLKSSGSQPRIVLEKLFLEMCLGPRRRGAHSASVSA
jgi:DNA polymerase-3 subunit delta